MNEGLPFGLTVIDLVTLMVGAATFVALVALWQATLSRDPMRTRLKDLQQRRDSLRAGLVSQPRRKSPVKRRQSMSLVRGVVSRLKLLQGEQTRKIADRLMQAGWRSKDAINIFAFFKFVLPLAAAFIVVVFVFGLGMLQDSPLLRLIVPLATVLVAFQGPELFVRNAAQKRQATIRKALPDALDLMVICAEAGLTLDAALNRVTREMGRSAPELADELGLTAVELGFLTDRRQALVNLEKRVPLDSIRSVVSTLVQTERYGTPLAMALRVLSAEFRNERMMKAEEKAARLPATMTVPLILFILPTLFIVILGPAACQISDEMLNR